MFDNFNEITKKSKQNMKASLWNSGFSVFKRRINEQLQLFGCECCEDDDTLLPYYRMGESETFVLSTLGVNFL